MPRFFKREEKLPFSYSAIEERRTSHNYLGWTIIIVLIITVGVIAFLIF